MKKILSIALCFLLLCVFVGCEKPTEGREAWDKFSSALAWTNALQYYSIDTHIEENGNATDGQLILSSDEFDRVVAYRRDGDVQAWWLNGVAYIMDGDKTKKAQSINSFLQISQSEVEWNYDMATNVAEVGGKVTFSVNLQGFDSVSVTGKIDGVFLTYISVAVTKADGTEKEISYQYQNCGQKPTVTLPSDLSEFAWEV